MIKDINENTYSFDLETKQITHKTGQNFTHLSDFIFNQTKINSPPNMDYIEFSKSLDMERDRDKIKVALKKFRRTYDNDSNEQNLGELVKPYFRGKRDLHHINVNATLPPHITEGHLFDQFNIFENMPRDIPSTRNHPEEIKRWMDEVLPKRSKEVEINGTICHQRALEMLNEDLKRNRSKPFAHYYKEAHIEQFCKLEQERFIERLASMSTTEKPESTKSLKQMRDEIKENIKKEGIFETESPPSGSQDMPSYLAREFKEKFPDKVNDNGVSVHESDFIFGHFRGRRSLSEELREKLSIENAIFKSRFKTVLTQSENKTIDGKIRDTINQNPMFKRFQKITINYDDLPLKEDWETDRTTLFSMENSLEEFINSNQVGDLNRLIGLKQSKIKSYLNSLNSSLDICGTSPRNKNYSHIQSQGKSKGSKTGNQEYTKLEKRHTRPTFKKILRTQVFNPRRKSLHKSEEESEYFPIHSNETFLFKNFTKTLGNFNIVSTETRNRNLNSIDEMEFKDGLFGLQKCHKDAIGNIDVTKKFTRTTDIIIKRFARINSTWQSRLKTKVFKIQGDSDMRQYEFDSSACNSLFLGKNQRHFGRTISSLGSFKKHSENYTDIRNESRLRKRRSIISKRRQKKVILRRIRNTDSLSNLEAKAKFKKQDFLKDWDVRDERVYDKDHGGHQVLTDDGTGDIRRLIREQCKDSSEEEDLVGKDKELFNKFKEIDDYGARSMPSHLKPDGGKTDENFNASLFNEFIKDVNKSASTEITLDSKAFVDNIDDASRRYRIRLERLEKLTGLKLRSPGPGYFTMPSMESRLSTTETMSLSSTKHVSKKQWITADSEDLIEGNKEDFEHFLNFEADENHVPWTEFDAEGMEKFLGKTLTDRNSTRVYKLYRP